MNDIVCYIPSYNDSELVRQSLASSRDWDTIISENASDEPNRDALAALASERVHVIRHDTSLGRVGNWKFCADHFAASGRTWMKFLAAGDLHKPEALGIYHHAMSAHPEAGMIVCRVEVVEPTTRWVWAPTDDVALFPPEASMRSIVTAGNVFHSLQAVMINSQALRGGYHFGEETLSYCADLRFLMSLACGNWVLYVPEVALEFCAIHRRHFKSRQWGLEHLLEEGLLRLRAADLHFEITGDRAQREQWNGQIAEWLTRWLSRLTQPPSPPDQPS